MSQSPAERLLRFAPWILLLLTAAAYAGVPHLGFVWDDIPLVRDNLVTGDPEALRGVFGMDLWETAGGVRQGSGYYRPLILLDLALDRWLWDLSTAGHHLHSLGWHLLAVGLLYRLARRLVAAVPALTGAALFALHPIQSESVIWIAARNDSMAASFVFASCLVLLPGAPGASPARRSAQLVGGALLVLAGLLSKETAILAPLLLLGLDLARGADGVRLRSAWPRHAAAWSGVLVWGLLRWSSGVGKTGLSDSESLAWLASAAPQLLGHYAARVLWPYPLTVGYTVEYLHFQPWPHLAALLVAAALIALLLWRGKRLALVGLLFAAAAMAPTVLAIAMRGQLGERYLYLPLGGLALALAAAWPQDKRSLGALLPLCLLSLGVVHKRVPEWSSDLSIWHSAHRDAPSPYTAVSLAHALNGVGEHRQATLLFHEGLAAEQPYLYACDLSIKTPLKHGMPRLAAQGADLSLSARCPEDDRLRGLRSVAFLLSGRAEDARTQVSAAETDTDARLPLAEAALALIDGDRERFDELDAALGHPEGFEEQALQLARPSGRLSP